MKRKKKDNHSPPLFKKARPTPSLKMHNNDFCCQAFLSVQ